MGLIAGSGRSPGGRNGNPLQYSCLENPVDKGACQATVHGVAKSRTRLSDYLLSPQKRGSLPFEALKLGIDFSFLVMKVLDGIFFFPNRSFFVYTEILIFPVATFINYFSYSFWIACRSFYISTCFIFILCRWLLTPHEPTSAGFRLFFCRFFTLPVFKVLKRVRSFLQISLWLKGLL